MQIITTLLPPPCFSDTTIASDCRKATNLQLEYHIWNIHLQTHTHTHMGKASLESPDPFLRVWAATSQPQMTLNDCAVHNLVGGIGFHWSRWDCSAKPLTRMAVDAINGNIPHVQFMYIEDSAN